MKRLIYALPALALIAAACEEPFTPKVPFQARPVVTCIVDGTNEGYTATATVAQTYDVSGLDPLENTKDPFDTSAVVTISMNGIRDTLKLARAKRTDTSRYTTPMFSYRKAGVLPYFSTGSIVMSIRTGNGKSVSATTAVPRPRLVSSSYQFVAGVTANTTDEKWTLDWDNGQRDDHLYFPKLLLAYQVIGTSSTVSKTLEIPLRYVEKDGRQVPIYPQFTRELSATYDFAALETALASISEGDSVKSRYKIGMLTFNLVEYDINLSNYYASSHGYLDQYSIRVDETTYSNISGGIGIFGSSFRNRAPFEMNVKFVRSFGYQI